MEKGGGNMNEIPQSIEAERALLGCVFIDNSVIIQTDITPEMFYMKQHEHIFRVMKDLKEIDIVTVQSRLKEKGIDMKASYLVELTGYVPTSSHFKQYAKTVKEKYVRRKMIGTLEDNIKDLYDESADTEDTMNYIKDGILKVETTQRYLIEENPNLIEDWYKNYDKPRKLIKTGIQTIDKVMGGIDETDLMIIMADTNVGKTTLMLNFAIKMATARKNVLFFSLEMSSEQLNSKMIAINSKLNAHDLYTRATPKDHLSGAVKDFKRLPITIVSRGAITSQDVIAEAYNRKLKGKVDIIMVDYLQILSDKSDESEHIRLTTMMRNLKSFALTNKIPIITPVQVDKASSKSGKIRVENAAGSKEIGNSADTALYLYEKESKISSAIMKADTELRLKVVKSRHSAKGSDIAIDFDRTTLKMSDFNYEIQNLTKKFK